MRVYPGVINISPSLLKQKVGLPNRMREIGFDNKKIQHMNMGRNRSHGVCFLRGHPRLISHLFLISALQTAVMVI